jgi:hypothetical protein
LAGSRPRGRATARAPSARRASCAHASPCAPVRALGLVQAAVTYYGAYPGEIDGWIERNEREASEAHAAWLAGHAALRR